MKLSDKECFDSIDSDINSLVPWYILASYAYYIDNDPIITKQRFKAIVKQLIHNWDNLDHPYKGLLSISAINSNKPLDEYPKRIKDTLGSVRQNIEKK